MKTLEQIEQMLPDLTRAEIAELAKKVVQSLGESLPGIESTTDVCGGEPCIVRTRIPVWILVQSKRLGMSETDILRSYPTLRAEDLTNAWAYERLHREEIDRQIAENENA
jgi:uncharacterized protein (DUF433 family)